MPGASASAAAAALLAFLRRLQASALRLMQRRRLKVCSCSSADSALLKHLQALEPQLLQRCSCLAVALAGFSCSAAAALLLLCSGAFRLRRSCRCSAASFGALALRLLFFLLQRLQASEVRSLQCCLPSCGDHLLQPFGCCSAAAAFLRPLRASALLWRLQASVPRSLQHDKVSPLATAAQLLLCCARRRQRLSHCGAAPALL